MEDSARMAIMNEIDELKSTVTELQDQLKNVQTCVLKQQEVIQKFAERADQMDATIRACARTLLRLTVPGAEPGTPADLN